MVSELKRAATDAEDHPECANLSYVAYHMRIHAQVRGACRGQPYANIVGR